MFQVLQMFYGYDANISYGYCKSSSGCCICWHVAMVVYVCCKLLFPTFHLFSDVCCKCVYLDVAYVSHICLPVFYLDVAYVFNGFKWFLSVFCKCFRHMFQVFHLSSDVCCKCYIWIFQK
jgi:hypothetical protein